MADFQLPNFSINLDSVDTDILELLKIIKPGWSTRDIKIKTLCGGYSCCTSCAIFQDNKNDAITIKVRKLYASEDHPLIDRDLEISFLQLASKYGIFPKIYAVFQNGYCYQYIRGLPIANNNPSADNSPFKSIEKVDDIPLKLIANKIAQYHCIKVDGRDYTTSKTVSKIFTYFETKYPTTSNPQIIEKDVLRKEYTELMSCISKLDLKIVQCHGDLNMGNIIWNKNEDSVIIVDWEGTNIGYQAYDIANFFVSLKFSKYFNIPGMPIYNEEIEEQLRKEFITVYLNEYFRLSKQCETVPKDYMEKFVHHVKFCSLLYHLYIQINMGALFEEFQVTKSWDDLKFSASTMFQDYILIKNDIMRDLQLN